MAALCTAPARADLPVGERGIQRLSRERLAAADTADFDGVGVLNLLEYALGTTPNSSY